MINNSSVYIIIIANQNNSMLWLYLTYHRHNATLIKVSWCISCTECYHYHHHHHHHQMPDICDESRQKRNQRQKIVRHDLLWLRQHEVMNAAGVGALCWLGINQMPQILIHVLSQERHERRLNSNKTYIIIQRNVIITIVALWWHGGLGVPDRGILI